jgi:hypothetical protein
VLSLRYLLEPGYFSASRLNIALMLLEHLFAHHDAPPNLHDVIESAACLF